MPLKSEYLWHNVGLEAIVVNDDGKLFSIWFFFLSFFSLSFFCVVPSKLLILHRVGTTTTTTVRENSEMSRTRRQVYDSLGNQAEALFSQKGKESDVLSREASKDCSR